MGLSWRQPRNDREVNELLSRWCNGISQSEILCIREGHSWSTLMSLLEPFGVTNLSKLQIITYSHITVKIMVYGRLSFHEWLLTLRFCKKNSSSSVTESMDIELSSVYVSFPYTEQSLKLLISDKSFDGEPLLLARDLT